MRRAMAIAALVGLLLAGCGDEYEQGAGVYTTTAPETTSVVPDTAPLGPVAAEGAETARLSPRESRNARAAKRDARRFLRGYLRYSYGERVRVRNVFPGVLPRRPPRRVPGLETEERPRLARDGLSYSGSYRGRVILAARLTDGQVRTLTMARRGRGWAVREVR